MLLRNAGKPCRDKVAKTTLNKGYADDLFLAFLIK